MKALTKNQKQLLRILIGAVFYIAGIVVENLTSLFFLTLGIFIAAFLIIGGDVLLKAVRNIFKGKVFDENFLMSIASVGAFFISDFAEAVAVMLFYQVGELFQSYAVNRSRKSIAALMDIRPDYANLKKADGIERVSPDDVLPGDIIVIKPGERIPLDAVVIEGGGSVDTSALTGESLPRDVAVGDNLLSGCINLNGLITAEVTKEYGDSTVSKILDLVENASSKKAKSEQFITKFARCYTPIVVIFAAILAVIPPLITGQDFAVWINNALVFLVISCPCALVISVPLSFFGGIGGASACGILIKGSDYMEILAKADTVVFDKTGTLTKGVFKVQKLQAYGIPSSELLRLAAYAECYSSHPIAASLKAAYGKPIDQSQVSDVRELAGMGLSADVGGRRIYAGNMKLMNEISADAAAEPDFVGSIVHIAEKEQYLGCILISDELKADAKQAISSLKENGIRHTVMLTGDARRIGESIGKKLEMDEVYTELLPADKVLRMEELLQKKADGGTLCFVGDGINDAPVLAGADVGVAMGAMGSDAAIEAADIVIMDDEPSKLTTAIKISRKTLRIVKQNIVFALGVKLIIMVFGVFSIATMWLAVFADVGVAFLAILNAMRMLNVKKYKK